MNPNIRKRIGQGLDQNFARELKDLDENIDVGEVNSFLDALANDLAGYDEDSKGRFKDLIGEGKAEGDELTEKNEIYRAILIQYYVSQREDTQFNEIEQREVTQDQLLTPRQYFDNYAFDALQNLRELRNVDVDLQVWVAEKTGQLGSLIMQIAEEIERTGFLKKENFKFKVKDLLAEQTHEQKAARKQKRIEFLTEGLTEDLKQDRSFIDAEGNLNHDDLNELESRIEEEVRAQEVEEIRAEEETRNLVDQIKDENGEISDEDLDALVSEELLVRTRDLMLQGVLERMMEERAKGSYAPPQGDPNKSFDPIIDYRHGEPDDTEEGINRLKKLGYFRQRLKATIAEVAQDINRVNALPFIGSEKVPGLGAERQYTLAQDAAARLISSKFFERRRAVTNIQKVWRGFAVRRNTSAFQGTENADAEEAIGKAGIVVAALRQLDGYKDHKGDWIRMPEGKTLQELLEYESNGYEGDPQNTRNLHLQKQCKEDLFDALAKPHESLAESFGDFYRIRNLIKQKEAREGIEQTEEILVAAFDEDEPELRNYEEKLYKKLLRQMPGLEFVFTQIDDTPELQEIYSKGLYPRSNEDSLTESILENEEKLLKNSANQIRKWAGVNRFEPIERDVEDLQQQLRELQERIVDRNPGDEPQPNRFATLEQLQELFVHLQQQINEAASQHREWDEGEHDEIREDIRTQGEQFNNSLLGQDTLIQALYQRVQALAQTVNDLQEGFDFRDRELDRLRTLFEDNQRGIEALETRNQDLQFGLQGLRLQLGGFANRAEVEALHQINRQAIQELIQRIEEERGQTNIQIRQLQSELEQKELLLNQRIDALEQGLAERIQAAVQEALALAANNPQQPAAGNGGVGGGLPVGIMGFTGFPGEINVNHRSVETEAGLLRIQERLDQLNQSTEQQTLLLQQRLDESERATTALTNSLVELRDLVQASATQVQLEEAVAAINQSITGPGGIQETLLERIRVINETQIQTNIDQTAALDRARQDLENRLTQLSNQLRDATEEQARQLREVRGALELELAGVNRALERSEAQRAIDARIHEDNLRDTESRLKTGLDSMFASLTSDNEALREQIEKQREESKKKERKSLDPEGLRKLIAEGVLRDNLMPTIIGGAAGATLTEYGEPIFSYSGIETGNLFMSHANAAFDNWDTSARDENSTYTSLTGKQRNPLFTLAKFENRPVPGGEVPIYCFSHLNHEIIYHEYISEATFLKDIDQPLAAMHAKKTKSVKEAFAREEIPSLKDSLLDGVAEGSPEERLMKKIYDKVSKENALAAEVEADKALIEQYREIIEGIAAPFDDEKNFRLDLLKKGKFKELRNSLVDGNGDFREDFFLGVGQGAQLADRWDNLNIRRNGQSVGEIDRHYQGIIDLVDDVVEKARLQALLDEPTRDLGGLLDLLTGGVRGDITPGLSADRDQMLNAQRLLTKIKFGEVGLTKSMQEYSEQNYPIILKTLEEEHQRLDTVIKDKERNLRTQGETDFVKDKYKKIIDMMADRPLKEDMELVLQGPGGVDLVFGKLFELDTNTNQPAHGCIFSNPDIIARFNALSVLDPNYEADKADLCRDAIAAIDTNRPTKLQMLERLNRDENIADLLFDSTRDARGTVTYANPKYEGLFDQVVLDIPRPRITGIVDNSATAIGGLAVVPPVHGVPDDITKFQNIINLMSDRPSRADFGSILLTKGADELLQQLFEKDPGNNYANRCVFNVGAAVGIIAEYEALVDPGRHDVATPAEKLAFCQRAIAEVDINRPTKRQMQNLLDRGNFADIQNELFDGAGNPNHQNLFETIARDNPIPIITNVVNRDVNVGDLARSSVNPVEKAAHVANFMGSRGAQVERAKQAELKTAIERIKDYPATVVAGDMRPINHDGLVTKVLKDNKLVDKVAQESANKVSAVYNEGFFADRAEIAKIRTQEGASLNPEEKRRMLEKSSALGSVLDLKFGPSTFQGMSWSRPSRNQFSVMFNGDFGVAGSGKKCGITEDIFYVPVPGGHKAFMRARICTSNNLEARTRTGKDGPETYYVLSVYKKGVLSEEEHRVGDVVMDYDTVFHQTEGKDGASKYEPVSLGSVKESVFQGAAKTFNLVKGAATLLVPSILKPSDIDSSIKGEQEFGKREFAEIRQTVKNMQVLIGSTGNDGERAFSTLAQGEVINHTAGRRTYVKTFLRPGYDNSVRVYDRTALARDGERLEFKFDKDGNVSGGVADDTIRITENGHTNDYHGSSRFVDSKYLKMPGVNADIELFGKVSVVSHTADEKGTDKAGDVVFSPEIFYKILQGGREVILPVFERGTTTPTDVFKTHLREQMLAKDPTAVPPPTISDEDIRQKLEEMQNKFLGSASVSVSIKPWKAALDHTVAIEGGEWKLHAIQYDSKARDSVVEVEAGRNGTANSALKMDLLQALASQQAQAVTRNVAESVARGDTPEQQEAAKNIPDQDTKNGLDALRTGIGAASKKEIANLNKGIFKTPPLECVLRGKAKPLPEIVTTKKHSVFSHAGRAMNRPRNNIGLGLADGSGLRRT